MFQSSLFTAVLLLFIILTSSSNVLFVLARKDATSLLQLLPQRVHHQVPPPHRNISVTTPPPFLQASFSPRNTYNPNRPFLLQWTGGDGDTSIQLSSRYVLFIFADTLVGNYALNKTTGERYRIPHSKYSQPEGNMPHSSVGIYDLEKRAIVNYTYGEEYFKTHGEDPKKYSSSYFGNQRTPSNNWTSDYFWPITTIKKVLNNPLAKNNNTNKSAKEVCITGVQINPDTNSGKTEIPIANGTWVCCLGNIYHFVAGGSEEKENEEDVNLDPSTYTQRWSFMPHTGAHESLPPGKKYSSSSSSSSSESSSSSPFTLEWRQSSFYNEKEDMIYLFGNFALLTNSSIKHQILSKITPDDFVSFNWLQGQKLLIKTNDGNSNKYVSLQDVFAMKDVEIQNILKPLWFGPHESIPEFTVDFSTKLQRYFTIFIPDGKKEIVIRFSKTNQIDGEWESPTNVDDLQVIYPLPKFVMKQQFCYATKTHRSLNGLLLSSQQGSGSKEEERYVFSYVCNVRGLDNMYKPAAADLYLPQFMVLAFS